MRVLFTVSNWAGDYFCMVSQAWALQSAGHEVRVVCAQEQAGTVSRAGLTAVPLLAPLDMNSLARLGLLLKQDAGTRILPGLPLPLHPITGARVASLNEVDLEQLQIQTWMSMVEGLLSNSDAVVDFAKSWRPDIVCYSLMNEDGPLAARAVGVPAVYCPPGFFGVNETGHLYLGVPDPAQVFARHGLDPWDRSQVQHIIDPTPVAALPDHGSAVYHASRYVPYNGVGTLPEWEWAQEGRSDRKRVCIIWGRSAIGLFGKEPEALSHAVNASVELGADVVLVVPKEQAGHLGPLPENVRVVQDFPIHLLIRSSDAVVHHSSGNTLMNALALGVPQVALGLSDDAIEVGRRCDRTGASSTLPGFLAGYEEIRSAIARAIDDPSQRHAAEAVRVELEARPDPLRLVRTLEEIAGNG